MRQWLGISAAIAVGLAAVAAPILISIELSWREGIANERALTQGYARDVLHRTDEMGHQMLDASRRILADHHTPCSPADIDLMRRISVDSSYIEALGRIQGNILLCTSLGTTTPMALGPPAIVTRYGTADRLNVRLPISDTPLIVVSRDGIAYLLNPNVPMDTTTEGPNISMALFVPSSPQHTILTSQNAAPLQAKWFRQLAAGASTTFRSGGYVIAVDSSSLGDIAVLTAAPESYVVNHVRKFALIFIPFGLLGAALLAWAAAHVTRMQLSMPSQLRKAARRREFYVEYQPIVDVKTRRWVGAEALVRWRRRNGEIVVPDRFIPLAEESGIIPRITACVTEILAADLPSLLAIAPDFIVSINISAADLRSGQTVGLIRSLLKNGQARPRNIKIEATEHSILQGKEAAAVVAEIRSLGIEIAIDDFGTGYSNFARLQTLGVDILKIDKDFVDTIAAGPEARKLLDHIIAMANSLGLVAVAEGVETELQARFLEEQGIQLAQGWLYAKAIGISQFRDLLHIQQSRSEEIPA
ncbi:MAG: EAL domain-containing protein [Acidobacteriota bacterium]